MGFGEHVTLSLPQTCDHTEQRPPLAEDGHQKWTENEAAPQRMRSRRPSKSTKGGGGQGTKGRRRVTDTGQGRRRKRLWPRRSTEPGAEAAAQK